MSVERCLELLDSVDVELAAHGLERFGSHTGDAGHLRERWWVFGTQFFEFGDLAVIDQLADLRRGGLAEPFEFNHLLFGEFGDVA